ncbi:MAG: glycosyltransferase family 4 protein [Chthoniobacterales bacterium]
MKIAIFTPTYLPKIGGAEIFHHNLATRLSQNGHKVTVILPRKFALALAQSDWQLNYQTATFPTNVWSYFKRWPWLAYRLANHHLDRLQKQHRFDIWHAVMMYPAGLSLINWASTRHIPHLVRSAGDDIIAALDGSIGMLLNKKINRLVAAQIPRASTLIALSESIENEFLKLGVPQKNILQIPNAVDLDRFAPADKSLRKKIRKRHQLAAETFLFLSVGRNHSQKNYPTLLDALEKLAQTNSDFQHLIIGRDTDKLTPEIKKRKLQNHIRTHEIHASHANDFPPQELVDLYRSADAFVMPSILEGFSTALLEAAAAGLPIITSDGPGCKDFVRNGKDGIISPVNDAEKLAKNLKSLLENEDLRKDYHKRALARAQEFSWPKIVETYENSYHQITQKFS